MKADSGTGCSKKFGNSLMERDQCSINSKSSSFVNGSHDNFRLVNRGIVLVEQYILTEFFKALAFYIFLRSDAYYVPLIVCPFCR